MNGSFTVIVVTTPTGLIGHQVLANLLDSGEEIRVRVIARDPSRLSPRDRERVEVVQGSHDNIDVVTRAFAGADSVFWLVPPDYQAESGESAYVDFSRPACDAFKSQGMFFSPLSGDRQFPTCATRDIAAVAARLLLDDSWSGQDSVPVLGPEDLSFNDMAQIISQVLQRPVRFQQISGEAFKATLTGHGMSTEIGT
jgi:uncharacterized protein YbjT (DUF2867 family)